MLCEDAAELTPAHPHVVRLLAATAERRGRRSGDAAGPGARARPDAPRPAGRRSARRGGGRDARRPQHRPRRGCGTLHANRPARCPRLEALGVAAGLDRAAVHSQAAAALAVIVHLRRTPARRMVDELGVVRRSASSCPVGVGWRADGGPCPAGDRLQELALRRLRTAVTGARCSRPRWPCCCGLAGGRHSGRGSRR